MRYRDGHDAELTAFTGHDPIVFVGADPLRGVPFLIGPLGLDRPVFWQRIGDGDLVVRDGDSIEVLRGA